MIPPSWLDRTKGQTPDDLVTRAGIDATVVSKEDCASSCSSIQSSSTYYNFTRFKSSGGCINFDLRPRAPAITTSIFLKLSSGQPGEEPCSRAALCLPSIPSLFDQDTPFSPPATPYLTETCVNLCPISQSFIFVDFFMTSICASTAYA
ncbi:hypothetical protein HGRIS_005898 [Hohenbuehelia grisea]|uniref:Uncharacterized protein n=1 Tax=Hohenbuehelia grisea TaxID=104357 RepID=A0ABR3JY73_9AGAR